MTQCPCGSQQPFNKCCQPLIEDNETAKTPEALMRSRYVAFTLNNIAYIQATMKGPALAEFNSESTQNWNKMITWLGLQVIRSQISKDKDTGWVQFCATYENNGKIETLHEKSEFKRIGTRWFYFSGKHIPSNNLSHPSQSYKTGRNSLCPCGSGKKFKKCCGVSQ